MEDISEIVFTSDYNGLHWNCCAWELATGTVMKTYKNGTSTPHTLCVIGQDFLISAQPNKSVINVWNIHNREQTHQRIITPGHVLALTVTSDNSYCIAAISEKIYIWQICTGELLKTISQHYQSITCLKATDYGMCFISAGQDSLAFVWDLGRILGSVMHSTTEDTGLVHTWSHHSLAITDVHIGKGGRRARAVTVSLDQTCRLYNIADGNLLLTVVFDVSITAVTMDNAEFNIFCGSTDGRIFQVNLYEPPPASEYYFNKMDDKAQEFIGHEKAILALAVSANGRSLVSGSQDNAAMIWNIASHQCLRVLSHKGFVTNVIIMPKTYVFDLHQLTYPQLVLEPFKHQPRGTDQVIANSWKHTAKIQIVSTLNDEYPRVCKLASSIRKEAKKEIHEANGIKVNV